MATLFASMRYLVGVLALFEMLLIATPAVSQQPTSVNPAGNAVKEEQLLHQLKQVQGRISIPDTRESMLVHPQGRVWRMFHEVTLRWIGAVAIIGMLGLIVIFYLWRGMIRLENGRSGRKIVRFNAFERFVHWMTATCFILQALTGLNITFGKPLLMPLMSAEAFSAWSQWAKYVHNYLSFPFTLGVILIFFMWIGGNVPSKVDVEWIKRGGGLVGHDHPPAYRFNAGQKAIYWIQVLGGTAVAISGYVLMFPFYGTDINNMQAAEIVHGTIAMLFIAIMIAHVYIGTIGMEGAFEGMGEGTVDLNWAREHHQLWVEEEIRRGEAPAGPSARPVPAE